MPMSSATMRSWYVIATTVVTAKTTRASLMIKFRACRTHTVRRCGATSPLARRRLWMAGGGLSRVWTGKLGWVAPGASSRLAMVAGRDFLREAQGRTLTKGQILDSIARIVENMAERDKDWSRLAEQLHAVLVDPEFDLDAPVDLADLMAVIAKHHEAQPPEPPVEAPRRDEFPGGPQ